MAIFIVPKTKSQEEERCTKRLQQFLAGKAAKFYAATFPDSSVERVSTAPADFPGGQKSSELTVEFTVLGRKFAGPYF